MLQGSAVFVWLTVLFFCLQLIDTISIFPYCLKLCGTYRKTGDILHLTLTK